MVFHDPRGMEAHPTIPVEAVVNIWRRAQNRVRGKDGAGEKSACQALDFTL